VLVYLEAPNLVGRVLDHIAKLPKQPLPDWATTLSRNNAYGPRGSAMLADMPPTEGLHFAFILRNLKTGWTLKQREAYFAYLIEASKKPGGASYPNYILNIREEALANCTPAEKVALTSLTSIDLNRKPGFKITPPKGPGQTWTVKSALTAVNKVKLRKRNFKNGQNLFFSTACAACHRLGGFGGAIGPDLTSAGGKLDLKNLLETIIEPSKAISDQFGSSMVSRKTGPMLTGLVVDNDPNNADGTLLVFTHDPKAKPVKVAKADVKSVTASPVSQMPPGLINSLNENELADLVAYLLSGGNNRHRVYK
jgi:putative heme-binding domain-containing protein